MIHGYWDISVNDVSEVGFVPNPTEGAYMSLLCTKTMSIALEAMSGEKMSFRRAQHFGKGNYVSFGLTQHVRKGNYVSFGLM